MRKRLDLFGLFLVSVICGLVAVAVCLPALGEGTATEDQNKWRTMNSVTVSWTITSNGWAQVDEAIDGISGLIYRIVVPAISNTNTYDLLLKDAHGIDLLYGSGSGLTDSTVEVMGPWNTNYPVAINGDVAMLVTNAHSTITGGSFVAYWR